MNQSDIESEILQNVSEEGIIEMSKDVISIPSPTGSEWEMAKYMRSTFEGMGLRVQWQNVEEGRANVIGHWEGAPGGKSLMFNGHMDTSYSGDEPHLTGIGFKPFPVVKDGTIFGLGIYNMKGALVCYTHAVKAVQAAGIPIKGDLMISAVAGEIEKAQWGDEFAGQEYRGYGTGTRHMVCHGTVADMCILGEPTDMKMVLGHYGSLWVRISTSGPYMHTGFSSDRQPENSIWRMRGVLDDVIAWAKEWREKTPYGNKTGLINIGGIKGGNAWRASRTPERTDLYLDVRVPPTLSMPDARRQVKAFVDGLREKFPESGIEFETYVSAPGAEIAREHEMVQAIQSSHTSVMGTPPEEDTVIWGSDASTMTRYGIETINYGPSSGLRKADGEKVDIDVMVNITKVYALAIARLLG